jgi:hypothetical protein
MQKACSRQRCVLSNAPGYNNASFPVAMGVSMLVSPLRSSIERNGRPVSLPLYDIMKLRINPDNSDCTCILDLKTSSSWQAPSKRSEQFQSCFPHKLHSAEPPVHPTAQTYVQGHRDFGRAARGQVCGAPE